MGFELIIETFVLWLMPSQLLPPGMKLSSDELNCITDVLKEHWPSILLHYWKLMAAIMVFFFLPRILVLSISFILKKFSDERGPDGKQSKVTKRTLVVLLGVTSTSLVLVIGFGFYSYLALKNGIVQLPVVLQTQDHEREFFSNQTLQNLNTLQQEHHRQFVQEVTNALYENSLKTRDTLERLSTYFPPQHFQSVYDVSYNGIAHSGYMGNTISALKDYSNAVQVSLKEWKKQMTLVASECTSTAACAALKQVDFTNLSINQNFDQFPDFDYFMTDISFLRIAVEDQVDALEDGDIPRFLRNVLQTANRSISDTRKIKEEEEVLEQMIKSLRYKVADFLNRKISLNRARSLKFFDSLQSQVKTTADTWFYAGCVALCLLLVTVTCFTVRKFHVNVFSQLGSAYHWKTAMLTLMRLTWLVILGITAAHALIGAMNQKALSDGRTSLGTANDVDGGIMSNKKNIIGCDLSLSSNFEPGSVVDDLIPLAFGQCGDMAHVLEEHAAQVKIPRAAPDRWIGPNKERIIKFATSDMWDVNVTALLMKMEQNITWVMGNITEIENSLISSLQNMTPHEASIIQKNLESLKEVKSTQVPKLTKTVRKFLEGNHTVESVLGLNHSALISEVFSLINETDSFARFYQDGKLLMGKLAPDFEKKCKSLGEKYLTRLENDIADAVEVCVSESIGSNSTMTFANKKIFLPLNGIWICVAGCHVLLLLCLFLVAKLWASARTDSTDINDSNERPSNGLGVYEKEEFELEDCPSDPVEA